jgi:hypothetical protein
MWRFVARMIVLPNAAPIALTRACKLYSRLEVFAPATSKMLFTIRRLIAAPARMFPLKPGDVLATDCRPDQACLRPPILAGLGICGRIR